MMGFAELEIIVAAVNGLLENGFFLATNAQQRRCDLLGKTAAEAKENSLLPTSSGILISFY